MPSKKFGGFSSKIAFVQISDKSFGKGINNPVKFSSTQKVSLCRLVSRSEKGEPLWIRWVNYTITPARLVPLRAY